MHLKINILQKVSQKIVVRAVLCAVLGVTLFVTSCRFGGFDAQKRLSEGEEYYRLGTSSNQSSRYEESTTYLKHAEEVLLSIQPSELVAEDWQRRNQLLGYTWFYMGNSCESDQLYNVAQGYYRKAIPLLKQGSHTMYLACAYRDLARTIYQLCYPDSVEQRLAVCRRLAEEYGAHARYSEIVEILLAEHATDSAAYYLQRLQPKDSAYAYWFEQSYTYLRSKVLRQRGQSDTAYALLLDLYDRKIDELQRDAGARTYALALQYDVEREKQLAAEAQRERRWQQTVSVILVLLLVLSVVLMVVLWRYWHQRRREQTAAMQALREKYVQQLQLALERLQQKVSLTREIEMQRMRGKEVEFPKWLQTYRDEQLTMSKESLNELVESVDKALDGAISRLRADYPQLTESDMQFAILSIIGATDNDMSILLNVQKQTIYHRRQIVRKHIDATIDDIDAWLRAYVLKIEN